MRAAEIARELRAVVTEARVRLSAFDEGAVSAPSSEGRWSRKEVLGHLVDSAFNNHQRFLRARFVKSFVGPGYEQDEWVRVQAYRDRPWGELLVLWDAANRHVAYAMESVEPAQLATLCHIGDEPPQTLEWLMTDYIAHLRHHLAQIVE